MVESVQVVCAACHTVNRVPPSRLGAAPHCGRCRAQLFTGGAVDVGGEYFNRHISRSGIPVVVDFWAPWCGPCHLMAPVFEQAARQFEPAFRFLKLNTEREQAIAGTFNIQSIPTTIVFHRGREVSRQLGALNLSSLVQWLQSLSL